MTAATHPPADTLSAFGRGELPPDELATVADHVAACADCCAALGDVRDDSLVGLLRELRTPPDDRTNATPAGSTPSVLAFPDARSVLADHPQYRLLDQLGEGGMGVVFRAEHKVMGRVVALKVMAPHLTEKPSAVARFKKEVSAAGRLNHPNIVTAHDAGEAGGLHFLVMEYVEGVSLDKLVAKKGPLPVPQACQFVRQAAQGLQHAHDKGMVHRDIKPQNLMVTRKGHVKVLDFGLARFARDAAEHPPEGSSASTRLPPTAVTGMNMIMGTPDYLSPEQARCAAVDIRADVYSLGCTLYFLLTGRAPFEGAGSVFDKILAHATEPQPSLAATRLDVPGGLELVLAKMTAKDPAARFATPADVAAALAPYARGEGAGTQPVVEAAFAPAPPAVTPPAASTLVPDPPPTDVIVRARPAKKRKKAARSAWTPARWAALAGVLVAVLIGGLVVRAALKKPPPTTAATTPTPEPPRAAAAAPPAKSVAATKPTEPAPNPWRGAPPQVLFVLPTKGLYPPDYAPVRERLEAAGVGVKVAVGPPPPFGPFEPGYSYPKKDGPPTPPVRADLVFGADIDLTPVRALVFVGEDVGEFVGPSPKGQATGQVIRRAREKNLVIGGICTGQLVLAKHGVLDGKTVARSPYSEQYAGRFGVPYPAPQFTLDDAPVRTAGRVVTAAGPEHAAAFADALAAALRE
ncbi:serine/threonine-protein kinase [Urbifossiella limnaea]|uniref:non-specific serine/threonine protein kinase n=1 Tax=Urbifossiella limnaea TaxID=2528023 RepID=A0A517XLY7_9BACT|nr:serine/threonine-protein kinase [Urbifossiella limnaea]QDU18521.1 Serine/threonine-protein kinase PrkC [Urbifossiella limnaea]